MIDEGFKSRARNSVSRFVGPSVHRSVAVCSEHATYGDWPCSNLNGCICSRLSRGRAGISTSIFLEYCKTHIQPKSTSIWVKFFSLYFKKIFDDVTDVDLTDISIFAVDQISSRLWIIFFGQPLALASSHSPFALDSLPHFWIRLLHPCKPLCLSV